MLTCKVLIIGGGMAAARLAKRLGTRQSCLPVVIAGDEPLLGYNRVLLPNYVAGVCTQQDMQSDGISGITQLPQTKIKKVNLQERVAFAEDERIHFEQLIFATGSTAPVPQLPGINLSGVVSLRSLADADEVRARAGEARSAVVLGGGLLGLEAADALSRSGLIVNVVHRGPFLMHRQLDQEAGEMLRVHLEARGIRTALKTNIARIEGEQHVTAVTFDNGQRIDADLIVLATGTEPRVDLARTAGIPCEDGIVVDHQLQTAVPNVFALGECANMGGQRAGLVALVNRQADVLVENLAGGHACVGNFVPNTHLKLEDLALFSAGNTQPEGPAENLVIRDRAHGVYRRLWFRGSTLIGAVLYGRTNGAANIAAQMHAVVDRDTREQLAFGY